MVVRCTVGSGCTSCAYHDYILWQRPDACQSASCRLSAATLQVLQQVGDGAGTPAPRSPDVGHVDQVEAAVALQPTPRPCRHRETPLSDGRVNKHFIEGCKLSRSWTCPTI